MGCNRVHDAQNPSAFDSASLIKLSWDNTQIPRDYFNKTLQVFILFVKFDK